MRKLLIFLLFFSFTFLFFFTSNNSSAYAITCTQAGGSCTPSKVCDAEGINRISATGCTSTTASVCCNFNTTCKTTQSICTSLGYQCGSVVNNCNQQGSCGTCTSPATCTNNKCVAPTAYTCELTPGQECIPKSTGSCVDNGLISATGTCKPLSSGAGQNCCKPDLNPPPQPPPPPPTSQITCLKCTFPYYYDPYTTDPSKRCVWVRDSGTLSNSGEQQTCSADETCVKGSGCISKTLNLGGGFTTGRLPCTEVDPNEPTKTITVPCKTAIADIGTDPQALVKIVFSIVLSISGGIAVLLIIISGYKLTVSQGNPEKIKEAQEQLTAAIVGLLFIIFAFSILNFIGQDILNVFEQ